MLSNDRLVGHPLLAAAGTAAGALATAARGCAWQLSDDQVQDAIALSLQIEASNAALRASLIAEANVRGLRERTQSTTTERWLADRYRLSTGDARARVEQSAVFVRHPRLTQALADGAVTVEQATVIAQTLDEVAVLRLVEECEREQAAEFLVEQAATLVPRDLARAGAQIVEALTRTPSVDDPAEVDALAREQRRAEEEAEAARRDLASWRHRLRPGRRGRGTLDTGPVGDALITAWEHVAGRKHPGSDGFDDDRTREQRLGAALLDMIADYLGQPRPSHGCEGNQQDTGEPDDNHATCDLDLDAAGSTSRSSTSPPSPPTPTTPRGAAVRRPVSRPAGRVGSAPERCSP